MMGAFRRIIRLGCAAVFLAGSVALGALTGSVPAGAKGVTAVELTWSVVPTPTPTIGQNPSLADATCVTASDCWAVGSANQPVTGSAAALAEHWDGVSWSIVPTPEVSGPLGIGPYALSGVACATSTDCWAVGFSNPPGVSLNPGLIEHWDGTRWSLVSAPNPNPFITFGGGQLDAVTCTTSSDCWAVGTFEGTAAPGSRMNVGGTLTEHWDGTSWSVVPSPGQVFGGTIDSPLLRSVACTSGSDCWAVGFGGVGGVVGSPFQPGAALAEHWDGTSWSVAPVSSQPSELSGVACVSSVDCWTVGQTGSSQALAEHWDGTSWSVAPVGEPSGTVFSNLTSVACLTSTNCWAANNTSTTSSNPSLAEHWNGTSWTAVPISNASQVSQLRSVTCVSSADCWMVGAGGVTQALAVQGTLPRDLAGANLAGLDLEGANVPGANASGANLQRANLSDATLSGSNLSAANLSGANLSGANLSGANLTGANLHAANLSNANLSAAVLTGANVRGVTWLGTTCPDGTNSDADGGSCVGHL